jgi:hypothetical protein
MTQLYNTYLAWMWSFPGVAAASLWWWETRRARNLALTRSFKRSLAACLPGALLWTEHVTRELAWYCCGLKRLDQVYNYPTTAIAMLSIPAVPILIVMALVRRPFTDTPRGTVAIQLLHLVWSFAAVVVATYFASGI